MSSIAAPIVVATGSLAKRAPAFAIALVILLASVALQIHLRTTDDVSWLITACEKLLAGQVPYVDFFEPNPPASLLLYLPSVALAHRLNVAPELAVSGAGFAAVFASLALSAAILARADLLRAVGLTGGAIALATFMFLPGRSFNERDHLAIVLALPFFALLAARGARAHIPLGYALVAGIGAGAMAAIKPPYVLAEIAPLAFLAWRLGWRRLFALPEYYVAAFVGLAYIGAVFMLFPGYGETMLPMMTAIYIPSRESPLHLMFDLGPTLIWTLLGVLFLIGRRRALEPAVAVPLLASFGALICFFIQAKGWSYQLFPALALLILAFANALDAERRRDTRLLGACLATCVATAAVTLTLARAPLFLMIGATILATLLFSLAERRWPSRIKREEALPIAELLAASAIGIAFVLYYYEGLPQPALERALARLGPHPTVMAISESLALGHPLTREAGGIWVQSVPSLWVTGAGIGLIHESRDDPAVKAKLEPLIAWDRARFLADLKRERPDALLVGKIGGATYRALWDDPEVAAARVDYVLYASNDDPDWPAALYARKDLVALRPALDEAAR